MCCAPVSNPYGRCAVLAIGLLAVLFLGCNDDSTRYSGLSEVRAADARRPETSAGRDVSIAKASLTETTELSPSGRYLIIHADDAGMCRSVNRATIEALERGAVTSASIMVPCPAFEEFAEYARTHPEYDYGIHLTLNAEYERYRWGPVLPSDEVPSLVDSDGYLWRSEHATAANARADDVERELRAQIEKALKHKVPLSHLDTHMGTLFVRPDFMEIYLRLGVEYQLPVLFTRDDGLARRLGFDNRIVAQIREAANHSEQEGFPVLDKIFMHYTSDGLSQKKRVYLDMIRSLPEGVCEIIVHCGYDDWELNSITRSARLRDGDRQVLTDPDVLEEIGRQDVRLLTWKQLSRLRAAELPAD